MTIQEYFNSLGEYTLEQYFDKYCEIEVTLDSIAQGLATLSETDRQQVLKNFEFCVKPHPVWMKIHILSFCARVGRRPEFFQTLLEDIRLSDKESVGEYNRLSHYWQIQMAIFKDSELGNKTVGLQLARLYMELLTDFSNALGVRERAYIPLQERNKDLVFVMTTQVLGMGHAPTKTLLDRCYVLQQHLGKEVFIINTAMQAPERGSAPFYKMAWGNYKEEYRKESYLEFRDTKFPFYQCENNMPDLNTIQKLIQMVKERKPYYIINIGGNDLCTDICGRLVPEVTIGTVFSSVATSAGQYQIIDKTVTEEDSEILSIMGVKKEDVKRAKFTFSFKEQEHHYTRAELGVWEDKFVLVVIGWRLDDEIDSAFLEMLENVVMEKDLIGVVFVGKYETYEEKVLLYPHLKKNSKNLGMQEDVLAVLDCCDLYVNPRRNGGGSSVSEALYKKIPAVTLPVGDVYAAAEKEFAVADYEEMCRRILKYEADKEFYNEMSDIAGKRAEELMDSEKAFGSIVKEIETELEKMG